MEPLQELDFDCPYCGEPISILADASAGSCDTIEDCEVCCCPINLSFEVTMDGECVVSAERE